MKDIKKIIKNRLKEQLDYSGSERMDPRLEKKLADPNSMFARNPAFKRGAADVQKLYSDSFNDLVEKVRNVFVSVWFLCLCVCVCLCASRCVCVCVWACVRVWVHV